METAEKLLLETILTKINTLDKKYGEQLEISHQNNIDINNSRSETKALNLKVEGFITSSCPRDNKSFNEGISRILKEKGISSTDEKKTSTKYYVTIISTALTTIMALTYFFDKYFTNLIK